MPRASRLFLAFILVLSVFSVTPTTMSICHGANGAMTGIIGC